MAVGHIYLKEMKVISWGSRDFCLLRELFHFLLFLLSSLLHTITIFAYCYKFTFIKFDFKLLFQAILGGKVEVPTLSGKMQINVMSLFSSMPFLT